jgi:hypothetical protein
MQTKSVQIGPAGAGQRPRLGQIQTRLSQQLMGARRRGRRFNRGYQRRLFGARLFDGGQEVQSLVGIGRGSGHKTGF